MVEPTLETAKIQSLEGLRGLMAWWVVLGHISLSFGWRLPLIDDNGLAVEVFIFLSGFVIARLIDRKTESYGRYITRRAFRLFPLYLIVLVVSAMLLPIQVSAWQNIPIKTSLNASRLQLSLLALANFSSHFLIHIPLLQGLIPNGPLSSITYTIVGQAWSISLEWQFYLLAPFLMWALGDKRRWPLLCLTTAAFFVSGRYFSEAYLGNKTLQFGVGVCSYLALDRKSERLWWLAIATALGAAIIKKYGSHESVPISIWALVLLSSAALSHQPQRVLANMLSSPIATHFGEISYSVYLVHMLPLYLSIRLLGGFGLNQWLFELCVSAATIILAYVVARATHSVIEKPGIRLGSKITSRAS